MVILKLKPDFKCKYSLRFLIYKFGREKYIKQAKNTPCTTQILNHQYLFIAFAVPDQITLDQNRRYFKKVKNVFENCYYSYCNYVKLVVTITVHFQRLHIITNFVLRGLILDYNLNLCPKPTISKKNFNNLNHKICSLHQRSK